LSGNLRVTNSHIADDGELYAISGDGDGGWQFMYGTYGSTITTKDINFGVYTIVDSLSHEGGYIRKVSDTQYELYMMEENGGLWQPIHFRTTDKGDTWTRIDDITG